MKKLLFVILLLTACAPGTRYTLHEDNDYFSPHTNDDRDFTQGLELAAEIPNDSGSDVVGIGQTIYTPGNKQVTDPQPEDRPYAGYLYGKYERNIRKTAYVQDTFGITGGIVGPHSYGKQSQNNVHNLIDIPRARGWDNQIHDEIGVILKAERNYALPFTETIDSKFTIGGHLGNVFTQAYTGYVTRIGYRLPDIFNFGNILYPRNIRSDSDHHSKWSAYVFAGPFVRAVARNIFLDGNTFRDSAHIDKKPIVAEGRLGLAGEWNGYRLTYTYIIQTAEFEGQPNGNDFGEITIGWEF